MCVSSFSNCFVLLFLSQTEVNKCQQAIISLAQISDTTFLATTTTTLMMTTMTTGTTTTTTKTPSTAIISKKNQSFLIKRFLSL
jgi:hypothetical protein